MKSGKEVAKFENFTGMQTTVEDNEVAFSNFSPEN